MCCAGVAECMCRVCVCWGLYVLGHTGICDGVDRCVCWGMQIFNHVLCMCGRVYVLCVFAWDTYVLGYIQVYV